MEPLGLADFIKTLRAELAQAQEASKDDALKLSVNSVEVTMQVAYTWETTAEGDTTAKARFWVLEVGAGVSGSARSEDVRTQQLKLVLTPGVVSTVTDQTTRRTRDVLLPLSLSGSSESEEDYGSG